MEIDSVIKTFGQRKILSNVYLKCQTGEIVGILGRNGCGKSTLLKILFGTLIADQKAIKIDNKFYDKPYQYKNLIAYLPQHSFLPENISLRGIIHVFIKDPEKRKKLIADERIKQHLKKGTKELSGGELRYFEITVLVNLDVRFILLDEPFSGIEPIYKGKIKELIKEYSNDKGFIITDHDYQNILDISDRLVLIKDGALINIQKSEQLEEYGYLPAGTLMRSKMDGIREESLPVNFNVDSQTLRDLDLIGNTKTGLIFSIFDNVKTTGGGIRLQKMLKTPISDINRLTDRRDTIKFFVEKNVTLKITKKDIDFIEFYRSYKTADSRKNVIGSMYEGLRYKIKSSNDYYIKKTGVQKTLGLLHYLSVFAKEYHTNDIPVYLSLIFYNIQEILYEKGFREILDTADKTHLNAVDIEKLDNFFSRTNSNKITEILEMLYEMDVFESVAASVKKYNLSFPEYSGSAIPNVKLEGLYHPVLERPVRNDFQIGRHKSLCFLTGANMSGKSTFLKAFGLAVYLAHVGFPVPASKMESTIFKGLITTINLNDNIALGYSHFYSEVKRVKEAASMIEKNKNVVVIFDELFRGTNVKDAFDASLMVISELLRIKRSIFLISTHIIEIAEELNNKDNIFFKCFESKMDMETPVYNYKLKGGVTKERFGMQIVKNERIDEILKSIDEN
ncbi:ATP-binding cassette domain-containing protein [Saccharicrinis sp. FJH2]|uniref:MutS-related protein n=1 Tax=Saccharicrinis sp. FJH65 TaxID=3344659 RepID=UPI0035F3B21D